MTLVRRGAHDRVRAAADARLARVRLRAGVAVIARGPIRLVRVRADPCACIAGPRDMTLVRRGAHHRVPAHAHPRLAGVTLGARIAVGTRGPVGLVRIRTNSRARIAGPREMTLIARDAYDRI